MGWNKICKGWLVFGITVLILFLPGVATATGESFSAAISLSGSTFGSVFQGSSVYYKFYVASGQQVTLTLFPSNTDQNLKVYNPSQTQIGSSSNSGTAVDRFSYTASTSGYYYAVTYGYQAGSYTISVSTAGTASTPGTVPSPSRIPQILRIIDEKTPEGLAALAAGPQWDAQSFQGFWYDLDDGLFSEIMKIQQTNLGDEQTAGKTRTIRDKDNPLGAGLTYQTTRQLVEFEVSENQGLTVENSLSLAGQKVPQGTHYGKLGWMAEEFVAVNGKAKKLAKLLIEQEEAAVEKKTLTVGESWQIGDWTLTAQSIDARADPRQVWFTLNYNGQRLDDKIVNAGEVYTYIEKSIIGGESDVPMFVTLVDSVFAGATTDMVQLRFTWAISRGVTEVKSGDTVGVFEVVDAGEQTLKLENDASIDLSTDSTVTLARNFVFKVADDADFLRFMPDKIITEPGTYDVRGYVLDEKTRPAELAGGFMWDAQSFMGFWYDLDDSLKSEQLRIVQTNLGDEQTAGKTRTIRDKDDPLGAGLTYQTTRQLVEFEVSENEGLTVQNSLNSPAGQKVAAGTHYGKLGWMAEEFVAVNGKAKKLAKLLIEQEEAAAEKKTLTVGESWQIGDWTLTAQSIDTRADPRQVWFTLNYNGQRLDDKIVNAGEVYTYIEKSIIGGESDVPMFVTLVDSVFAGATTDMVQLRFTWAISREVTEVKSGDTVGMFEVVDAGEQALRLENDVPIDLSTDSTVTLARSLKFKVADDADFLRFYPIVERTIGEVISAPTGTATPTSTLTYWSQTFGGTGNDWAVSVKQTSDGSYIIAGTRFYSSNNKDDFWLIKTDSNGSRLWSKLFGGTDNDTATSVQQTSDGGYILAGYTRSYGAGGDVRLIKTDLNGNEEWSKLFGGSDNDTATSVQQTSDGGYILAGATKSYGSGSYDAWLIKTNSNGNQEWNRTFGDIDDDGVNSVQQTSDGGYILAGATNSYGSGSYDAWLIKTNSSGNQEWSRTFGGLGIDRVNSVQQTSDGGYILAGDTSSYGSGSYDAWLIKTNSNGNQEWSRTFGDIVDDGVNSIIQTADGGYILAGYFWNYDAWLIKTNSSGNLEWSRTFGGSGIDWFNSVQQTLDGGYILAGATTSYGAGGKDVWLIKVSRENNTVTSTSTPSPTPITTSTPVSTTGTVTRTISPSSIPPSSTLTITLTPSPTSLFDIPGYQVIETMPQGFTYVGTSAANSTNQGNVYTFIQLGSSPITYTLTAPPTNGSYAISGTFKDENTNPGTVSGTTSIAVGGTGNLISRYDTSGDGRIQRNEAVAAVMDYFSAAITRQQAIEIVMAFFSGG